MIETLQPVLPKTPVRGLCLHIGRSGLCIGDPVTLHLTDSGIVCLLAEVTKRYLGLLPYREKALLGHLLPEISQRLTPALLQGAAMRVRIVDLLPEHLSGPQGPEVHISVWADPQVLQRLPSDAGRCD